jgi:hypothetical protein
MRRGALQRIRRRGARLMLLLRQPKPDRLDPAQEAEVLDFIAAAAEKPAR